ncbi:endo-beta-N-acetylglucosaminidase H [Streptomyces sp. NPDC054784]
MTSPTGRGRALTAILSFLAAAALITGGAAASPAATPDPAEAAKPAAPRAKDGPTSIAYVEVNNESMLNVGKYQLASDGSNVFDVAIIFAANINYDTGKQSAYLHFNENVQRVLDDAENQIRPLQDKGIKVMLSVLGNHEGAGFANFPSKDAASAFATQLSDTVEKYGLDGIDFDDEYADYGNNGTGQPNDSSFVHLVSSLRDQMPDKLISLYDIGPAADRLSYDGVDLATKFDYAWNPYYGTWGVPGISLPKEKMSPAAVQIGSTPEGTATDLAKRTVSEGYGVFLTYNLDGSDRGGYVSSFTRELYGSDAVYKP